MLSAGVLDLDCVGGDEDISACYLVMRRLLRGVVAQG